MKDFDDDELFKIDFVRQKFTETAKLFGFRFFEPSPLELLSTLETKSGPAIRDEIYFFKDKHDREVALRFDFTMGVSRFVTEQKSLKLPAKLASFGGVFRYDEPQKGRYRFFHQWNIEIFGKPSQAADAELIEFVSQFFEKLNLKNISIEISHRKLIESYIKYQFDSNDPKLISEIFRAMDKIQKKKVNDILAEYREKGIDLKRLGEVLEFAQIKGTPDEIKNQVDISKLKSWEDLKSLYDSLIERGIKNIRINFGIVRGLDYYSDFVFEAFDTTSDFGALVGGGRYDALPKAFGRDDIGATGVAGGVERIIHSLDSQGILKRMTQMTGAVLYMDEKLQQPASILASWLRKKNYFVDFDLGGKQFKKQLEHAINKDWAIIVAPEEKKNNKVIFKDLRTRSQKTIDFKLESIISEIESMKKERN